MQCECSLRQRAYFFLVGGGDQANYRGVIVSSGISVGSVEGIVHEHLLCKLVYVVDPRDGNQ